MSGTTIDTLPKTASTASQPEAATSVTEALATRRSIRAFSDRPVPLELIRGILDKARMSPSGCNFQPWQATVLTGAPLKALQEKLLQARPQSPEEYPIIPAGMPERFMERQREVGARMYASEGIDRDNKEGRQIVAGRNLTSFGAPVLLVCYMDRIMGPPQWSDVGMWLQSIMLLLREEGLDSCAQEYMALYARLIKDHIGVPDDRFILFCGLAIGYRDPDAPINNFERTRQPLENQVSFMGFED